MSSYVEKQFKPIGRLLRAFGCFFVPQAWHRGFDEFVPNFVDSYSAYFTLTLVFSGAFEGTIVYLRIVTDYLPKKKFSDLIFIVQHFVVAFNILTNLVVFTLGTDSLVRLLRKTKRLEESLSSKPNNGPRIRQKTPWRIAFCTLFVVSFGIFRRFATRELFEEPSTVVTLVLSIATSASCVVYVMYASLAQNIEKFFYTVLLEYLRCQTATVVARLSRIELYPYQSTARVLEKVRVEYSTVKDIVREMNAIYKYGIVNSTLCCVVTLCFAGYSLFDSSSKPANIVFYIMYGLYIAVDMVDLICSSNAVKEEALKMKKLLEMPPTRNLPLCIVRQVRSMLVSACDHTNKQTREGHAVGRPRCMPTQAAM